MVKVFVTQIKRGAITLGDVPEKWRKEVEGLLNEHTD